MRKQFLGIPELGHEKGIAQIGYFNVAAAGKNQLFQVEFLCRCRDKFFFMLETVPNRYVAYVYFPRHLGKDFPVVIFCHSLTNASFL
jgi:hypothetical protein